MARPIGAAERGAGDSKFVTGISLKGRPLADGGQERNCGWLKDRFGLSWQVVPTALGRYLGNPDRSKANRAMQAMMKMRKIIVADLDAAFAG